MNPRTVRAFATELEKLGAKKNSPEWRGGKAVDAIAKGRADWPGFEKDLKRNGFRKGVVESKKADDKLRRYTTAMGDYLTSKKVLAKVPSRTKNNKQYTVKMMKDGRLGCNCKDWQYKHSHSGGECQHIREVSDLHFQKAAGAVNAVLSSALATNRAQRMQQKGQQAKRSTQAIHQALGW